MHFIERLRQEVLNKEIYIFNRDDLTSFTKDELKNISNYDYKNIGGKNKNKKVLDSRKIDKKTYYSFRDLTESK